jgi:hypothetical protein
MGNHGIEGVSAMGRYGNEAGQKRAGREKKIQFWRTTAWIKHKTVQNFRGMGRKFDHLHIHSPS